MAAATAPSLLILPDELKLLIIGQLEINEQALLALTCRTFANLIGKLSLEDFLTAEKGSWASANQLFTCSGCKQFRHLLDFADTMRIGAQSRGDAGGCSRLCIACGIGQRRYTPGMQIKIMGKRYAVRHHSENSHNEQRGPGRAGQWLQPVREPHVRCQSQHDIDWDYGVPKHSDELYERWQHG